MPKPTLHTILGFDFGMKHMGVAIGQCLTQTARPLKPLRAKDGIPNWEELDAYFKEWPVDAIVVGIPYNMDQTPQHTTFAAKKFARRLQQRYSLPIFEVDERLTTVEAKQQLFDSGHYKGKSLNHVDSTAAQLIVEDWLRSYNNKTE